MLFFYFCTFDIDSFSMPVYYYLYKLIKLNLVFDYLMTQFLIKILSNLL